jgi:hypothetical protein
MTFLAVSQVYSAPSGVWPFFVICAAGLLGFIALVAGAAHLANRRDDRLHGRPGAFDEQDDHETAGSGPSGRPWEETYRRRGYHPDAELAAAETAGEERRAAVSSAHTPLAVSPSNPKVAPDAAEEHSAADA